MCRHRTSRGERRHGGDASRIDDPPTPGHVSFCPGTAAGPVGCRRVAPGEPGRSSLAIADVTGDRFRDVVEGMVLRHYGEDARIPPGGVVLLPGGPAEPGGPRTITQAAPGVPGDEQGGDRFGAAVAAGRLDRDAVADIVVGAPQDDGDSGRVTVLCGGPAGYRPGGTVLEEGAHGVTGPKRRGSSMFGAAPALVDVDANRRADVVAGAPGAERNGAVFTLRTGARRPVVRGARRGSSRALRLPRSVVPWSFMPPFGAALARAGSS